MSCAPGPTHFSPPPQPIRMLPLKLESSAVPPPPAMALKSIGRRGGKIQLSLRRSAVGNNNTLTILTSPSALRHRPSMPCFVPNSTNSSSLNPNSPPRPAPRRGPLLQLQVTPPTPPKKRREDLIQALRMGEEWRVGGGIGNGNVEGKGKWDICTSPRSIGRPEGLEKWSGVKVSGLTFGGREGAMTVGRGKKGRGEIVAVGREDGWF